MCAAAHWRAAPRRSAGSRRAARPSRPTCATGTAGPRRGRPARRDLEQRPDEAVELVLGAVVGVQRDVDRVVLGDLGGERGERDRAGDHVLDRRAGEVLRAAGRDLDDAVGAGLGEALQRRVEGLRRGHVDRGVGEATGSLAASSISAYFSGVAMGMAGHPRRRRRSLQISVDLRADLAVRPRAVTCTGSHGDEYGRAYPSSGRPGRAPSAGSPRSSVADLCPATALVAARGPRSPPAERSPPAARPWASRHGSRRRSLCPGRRLTSSAYATADDRCRRRVGRLSPPSDEDLTPGIVVITRRRSAPPDEAQADPSRPCCRPRPRAASCTMTSPGGLSHYSTVNRPLARDAGDARRPVSTRPAARRSTGRQPRRQGDGARLHAASLANARAKSPTRS